MTSLFHNTCLNNNTLKTPVWFMRQAGRYLPEYREVRKSFQDFISFCLHPEAACEVTLQPIKRFNFDAAIIFSDILIIPHLLGQTVSFKEGEGPILGDFSESIFKKQLEWEKINPVYQAINMVRSNLTLQKSLIGFCGTPWTLLCYMVHQRKIEGKAVVLDSIKKFPHKKELMNLLTTVVADHAINQIQAGCDVIQLFDSWASLSDQQEQDLLHPLQQIFTKIWCAYPNTPIVYYGRGVSNLYTQLKSIKGPLVLGVDESVDIGFLKTHKMPLQGNLSPDVLITGGDDLKSATQSILKQTSDVAHIFNLGHGIKPQTPIENVHTVIDMIREYDAMKI